MKIMIVVLGMVAVSTVLGAPVLGEGGLKKFLEDKMANGPLKKSEVEEFLKERNLDEKFVEKLWNKFAGVRTELSEKDVPELVDFLMKESTNWKASDFLEFQPFLHTFRGWLDMGTTTAYFLELTTENSSSVVLTHHHFLMSTPGLDEDPQMKRADEVAEGDFLLTSTGLEKVASIGRVTRQGYGSPLTMTGDLLVNGVLSSNYAHAPSHSLAHFWVTPFRWFDLLGNGETNDEDFVKRYTKLGKCVGDLLQKTNDGLAPGIVHNIITTEVLTSIISL